MTREYLSVTSPDRAVTWSNPSYQREIQPFDISKPGISSLESIRKRGKPLEPFCCFEGISFSVPLLSPYPKMAVARSGAIGALHCPRSLLLPPC